MRKMLNLVKRNCLVFMRNRSAVFFSLLAMLIVLLLQVVFLGNINEESVISVLTQYGGMRDAALDAENAKQFTAYWTLAGIMVVNALTVTVSVIGTMIDDQSKNRMESFFSAPMKKWMIALSYIISAVVIGFVMCMLTLGVALGYICARGGDLLGVLAIAKIAGYTLMNVIIFAVIMYMAAMFVKSSSAWGGLSTIIGTLVGFVGAIYLPMGSLPESVGNVLKAFPILHGASLMRDVCCADILEKTFTGVPELAVTEFKKAMGITVYRNDILFTANEQILILAAYGLAAFVIVLLLMRKKRVSDR
ncbi:MAG: ABC transporter permease [bacterium]|nr:ABC transporter permease [bacterium]